MCFESAIMCALPPVNATAECPVMDSDAGSMAPAGDCAVPPEKQCNYGKICW